MDKHYSMDSQGRLEITSELPRVLNELYLAIHSVEVLSLTVAKNFLGLCLENPVIDSDQRESPLNGIISALHLLCKYNDPLNDLLTFT